MEQEPIELNIGNICEGAIPQLFELEVRRVLDNIADVSTIADAPRSIKIELKFTPAPDRKSAIVIAKCESKICGVEPKAGSIFFAKRAGGKLEAFAEDPRQDRLFAREATITDSKN